MQVTRALRVIGTLAASRRGMTLQQLHEQLDIPIGSMHRVLAALTEEQYVTRSPINRCYFLGPASTELAAISSGGGGSIVTPPAPMEEAARESGETVFLTELVGLRLICVALVEARYPLRLFVRVGQEMPPHAAASARSVLAFLPPETVSVMLRDRDLTAYSEETPRTAQEMEDHLAEVRSRGYDVCANELDDNVWAVSAPVFTSTAQTFSSVTLAAAGHRMRDPLERARATETVLRAARTMSQELGYTGDFQVH
ncbi:IclR family transcriptional regulator [Streptomyces sp. NPDC088400]|uniref:IclR family transcriptional regulator n=1 Tax=Streptomyces sp. NPDC088400 TaxID=3365861 RepID=UPI00382001C0